MVRNMERPHQRIGSISNAHVGAEFEILALNFFKTEKIALSPKFALEIGLTCKKSHVFDLGSLKDKIIVECKSHRWTTGNQVPSAKMTVWNEAMFYFHLAPLEYRKIFFVLHDRRKKTGETLLCYYRRTYGHLIPDNVEFIEWDEAAGKVVRL